MFSIETNIGLHQIHARLVTTVAATADARHRPGSRTVKVSRSIEIGDSESADMASHADSIIEKCERAKRELTFDRIISEREMILYELNRPYRCKTRLLHW